MKRQAVIALKILLVLTVVTGIIYPLLITGIASLAFNYKANGSLISRNNVIVGSALIAQKFDSAIYFWSRPSAIDYNSLPSGGSNLGPTSDKLKKVVAERKAKFISANGIDDSTVIPAEMVFASASGLDPHTSPQAVLLQVSRIVKARNLNNKQEKELVNFIHEKTEEPQLFLLGEPRVNVFELNLQLDKLK